MRVIVISSVFILAAMFSFAQNTMKVHTNIGIDEYAVSETDSLYFNDNLDVIYFQLTDELLEYYVSDIDSITFDVTTDNTIYITYNNESVEVINPMSELGVAVDVSGANVIVNAESGEKDINYVLSGFTEEGMFKIYSDKRFNLLLNGVDITNSDWPAINIQSSKKCRVNLVYGTINQLTDGPVYANPATNGNGEEEDQNATFFSEGDLEFIGSGSLTVNSFGEDQHAIRSDDEIQVNEGTITITSAAKDGLHGKNGVFIYGGEINIQPTEADGIDSGNDILEMMAGTIHISSTEDDVKAIKSDTSMFILGGHIYINLEGNQSKAISSDYEMVIQDANIEIETSGNAVLEESGQGYEPSYCTAIDGGTDIFIANSNVEVQSDGEAGRGISSDGNLEIVSSEIDITITGDGDAYTDEDGDDNAYHGACFKVDSDFNLISGITSASSSGDGGKGVSVDGDFNIGDENNSPELNIITTGQSIEIEPGGGGPNNDGVYDEAKAITVESSVNIYNGSIWIDSADDGIKAEEAINVNGGEIYIEDSFEAMEAPNIIINDGYLSMYCEDDGFNATYGNGGEGNDGSLLQINGGYSHLNASGGDAIDSNGDFEMNGGTVVVHGPQNQPEVGMDVNGSKLIDGGFLVISGPNHNMTEGASNGSEQYSVLFRTNQNVSAHSIFHIEDSDGNSILNFSPDRNYGSIVFSSENLESGETYKVYTGGSCTGEEENGLYEGGEYSGGALRTTFTLSQTVSTIYF